MRTPDLFALCTRCGSPAVEVQTDDYAYCRPCEESFQAALANEFPHGQCWQCGVAYREVTCRLGKIHRHAFHVEGACGLWGELDHEADEAPGFCAYGCRPAVRSVDWDREPWLESPF